MGRVMCSCLQLSTPIDYHFSVNGGPSLLKNDAISHDVLFSRGRFYNLDQPRLNVRQGSSVPTYTKETFLCTSFIYTNYVSQVAVA